MKTHKVRPVLVEIKFNSIEEMQGDIIMRDNKLYTHATLLSLKKQSNDKVFKLILISLEDEKIEVGGVVYFGENIFTIQSLDSNADSFTFINPLDNKIQTLFGINRLKKVIARQSQISPEYISKFIKQYNNGCVEDLEIEMEDKIAIDGHTVIGIEPKITNGFVTIVVKEPITYTEEEVKSLFKNWLNTKIQEEIMRLSGEIGILDGITFEDWFNENKKK